MSRAHRDFGAATTSKEGVTFSLNGEQFETLPEAPSGVLNDLVAGIQYDEQGNRAYSAPNLIAFVCGVLRDERELTKAEAIDEGLIDDDDAHPNDELVRVPTDDVPRFRALVYDKRNIVPIDELGELVLWLAEELTDRPTRPSARSTRGRR